MKDMAEIREEWERRAALRERARIVAEIRDYADEVRRSSSPTFRVALSSIVNSVADRVNTMPDVE